tara:strand:+ start:405 stop:1397 length:993 start_codon:yes stop_codon:yes gene_type:complete
MYAHQRLLRAKNQIDVYLGVPCSKCKKELSSLDDEHLLYSKGDSSVLRDYNKNLTFSTVRVFLDNDYICQVNFLDNKKEILHSEFFRQRKFLTDDNIYLLPFFKVLNAYKNNSVPTSLRKLLIGSYNEYLVKAVQSTSNTKNAVYGKHVANYNPPTVLQKLFENEEIEVNSDIKEFVSESFYQKYQGKKLHLILTEKSTEVFLKQYKRQDKDNYVSWVIVNDFVNWYVKNSVNYKSICALCYGKQEMKRSAKLTAILKDSFLNDHIEKLQKQRAERKSGLGKALKENTKANLKKWRPSVYKAQYGEETTEVVIEKGQKITKTKNTKKNNK